MTHAGLGESHLSQLLHRMGKAPSVEAAIRAPRAAHEGDGDEASPFASNVGHALGVHRSRTFTRILSDPRR
jgi:hypothetical protein